jgi:hypothetical protein
MKAAHIQKVAARAERALELLLPFEDSRGDDVEDPKARLKDIIKRVDRNSGGTASQLANDIWALTELLESDIPALIQALYDAQADARKAREQRAGSRYQVTLMSDAPMHVVDRRNVPIEEVSTPS